MDAQTILVAIWVAFPAMTVWLSARNMAELGRRVCYIDTEGAKRFMRHYYAKSSIVAGASLMFILVAILSLTGIGGDIFSILVNIVLAAMPVLFFAHSLYEAWEVKDIAGDS